MAFDEHPLVLDCEGDCLVGIVASPSKTASDIAVLIVVGGPQYRAGSHRQFVQLARGLAAAGYHSLRFDVRGMGDSTGTPRSFEELTVDVGVAMDGLMATIPGIRKVVLWGLCDGASAALLYLNERNDPRVGGLVLVNPWVRTLQVQAQATIKHYYLGRLMDPLFWKKLLRGGMAFGALLNIFQNLQAAFAPGPGGVEQPTFSARMAEAWRRFSGPVLLVLSDTDLTAREFELTASGSGDWKSALSARPPTSVKLRDADHTCSQPHANRDLIAATCRWLETVKLS